MSKSYQWGLNRVTNFIIKIKKYLSGQKSINNVDVMTYRDKGVSELIYIEKGRSKIMVRSNNSKKKNMSYEDAYSIWNGVKVFKPTRFVLLKLMNTARMDTKKIKEVISRVCLLDVKEFGGITFVEEEQCYALFVNERTINNKEERPGLIEHGRFDYWTLA